MDKLGVYIIKLLQVNDKVHFPGIGTFKKERIPAKFDKESNSYLAPVQAIVFDEREEPDNLIINSITKEEGINQAESERKLQHSRRTILEELEEKGESFITGFGKLVKDNNTYTFIAEAETPFPLYKPIKEQKLITASNSTPKPIREETTEEITETIAPVTETIMDSTAKNTNWLWPVLICAIIAIAGSIWFLKPVDQSKPIETASLPDSNVIRSAAVDDVIPSSRDSASAPTANTTKLTEANSEVAIGPKYEIIIVSFGKRSEAEKYVADMNAKGYKIRILENRKPGNLYKVSYSSYSTDEEAQKELIKVKKELVKDAWIFKNNN